MNGSSWFGALRARIAGAPALIVRERVKRGAVLVFFAALFVAHWPLLQPLLQNGDSAVYNRQIADRFLGERTTHMGYMALGMVFDRVLPFSTDLNMNLMLLVVGLLGLAAVYSSAKLLGGSRLAALATVPLALGLSAQVRGMLLSEVDVVSVSFVALSFACFLREKAFFSGLLFGYSVLVTPLSGPLLTVFVASAAVRGLANPGGVRRQVRKLFVFGLGSLLVYLPAVLFFFQDYVHGPRGVLNAPRASLSVPERALHSWHFISGELGYLLPLYAAGALVCLLNRRLWRAGQPALALLLSTAVMAVVGERFLDVPVQLPNLVLLGMLPAIAFAVSRPLIRIGLLALFCACFLNVKSSYASLLGELERRSRSRELCLAIRAQSAPQGMVLVGLPGWSEPRMYERYAASPEQSAESVEWRSFLRRRERWLEPAAAVQIWFFHKVSSGDVARLLQRYSLENRTVGKRKFKVLVPRAEQ